MKFLVKEKECSIDDCDWELIKNGKFSFVRSHKNLYLQVDGILVHQLIFALMGQEVKKGNRVDHINRASLDNRRVNLRQITNNENFFNNRRKSGRSSSKYIGVSKDKRNGLWRAQCVVGANNVYLGLYEVEKDAAVAHDFYAITNFRNPLRLNFPEIMYQMKALTEGNYDRTRTGSIE